jgi:hypothetical protein
VVIEKDSVEKSQLLSRIGSSSGDGSRRWLRKMPGKGLGGAKKTSGVIWSDSETIINPLPGYD